jgi:hypothetical protein
LGEKLMKMGANVVSLGRYVMFRTAEVAAARQMFHDVLRLIARLRGQRRALDERSCSCEN